ncbi:imidazole glycerol phosphate synthase subunit HisF [Cryomorphaceae bacterium]|nr:imidazole glycerol phosphate synthase subunit HisF [Cryomorphaceae bacterium]
MLRTRVIPTLLLSGESLVKTKKFKKPGYIGDAVNTVRIFNELEVDEIAILGINQSRKKIEPNFNLLEELASECFIPLSYGGGITNIEQARTLFQIGFEKIIINSAGYYNPELITALSEHYGSQSVIGSVDYKMSFRGIPKVYSHGGSKRQKGSLQEHISRLVEHGVGEILLNSIDRDGSWLGFDLDTIKAISSELEVPLVACGGAGTTSDLKEGMDAGASALGVGSMVVYQSKGMGVLVSFPDRQKLYNLLR